MGEWGRNLEADLARLAGVGAGSVVGAGAGAGLGSVAVSVAHLPLHAVFPLQPPPGPPVEVIPTISNV